MVGVIYIKVKEVRGFECLRIVVLESGRDLGIYRFDRFCFWGSVYISVFVCFGGAGIFFCRGRCGLVVVFFGEGVLDLVVV